MMKSLFHTLLLLCTLGGLMSCSTYGDVTSSVDNSVDFKAYKTFAWLPDSISTSGVDSLNHMPIDNDIVRNNAKNYINICLTDRGYRISTDSPDVLVQLVLFNENKERVVTTTTSYPAYYYYNRYYFPYYYPYFDLYTYYGWGHHAYYWGYGYNQTTTYKQNYIHGTISINVFDRRQHKLVWTGSAQGDIYDPRYIQDDIHPAIYQIMKRFPVKPVKDGWDYP